MVAARSRTRRKRSAPQLHGRERRADRVRFFGKEPSIAPGPVEEFLFGKFLNWHSQISTVEEARGWLLELYAVRNPALAKRIKSIPVSWVPTTQGWCARAVLLGGEFPEERLASWDARVLEAVERGESSASEESASAAKRKPTVVVTDAIRALVSSFCAEIESSIDARAPLDVFRTLRVREVSAVVARGIAAKFKPRAEEIIELAAGADEDSIHALRGYSPEEVAWLAERLSSIVEDCERYAAGAQTLSRARKKAVTSREREAERSVSQLRWQREMPSMRVISVNPQRIIGAREAWLYNSKYGILTILKANSLDTAGLSARGLSVTNYDANSSAVFQVPTRERERLLGAIVRLKSAEALAAVVGTPRILQLPQSRLQHRTSDFTLILKVA